MCEMEQTEEMEATEKSQGEVTGEDEVIRTWKRDLRTRQHQRIFHFRWNLSYSLQDFKDVSKVVKYHFGPHASRHPCLKDLHAALDKYLD
jgi:hypothetical protein